MKTFEHLRVAAITMVFVSVGLAQSISTDLLDGTTPPGVAPGDPAGTFPLTGFDTVNLFNGNLAFGLPLLRIGGRGEAGYTMILPVQFRWMLERTTTCSGCTPTLYPQEAFRDGAPGLGPGLIDVRFAQEQAFCSSGTGGGTVYTITTLTRLMFIAPGGSQTELRDTQSGGAPQYTGIACVNGSAIWPSPYTPYNRGTEFASSDGSTMTFVSDTNITDDLQNPPDLKAITGYLHFRDGRRYRIINGLVQTIEDRNGNQVLVEYDPYGDVKKVTDSLQRVMSVTYPPTGGGSTYIWPNLPIPSVQSAADTSAVELGVKIRSDLTGYITGVRFYKGANNTGTHTGSLWSATGTLLATGTFANETPTGWQQLTFDTPVLINANTTYVASYHTNTGGYSTDVGYFQSQAAGAYPIRALQAGVDGPNGVYAYGPGGIFPSSSYSSTNYWVDVVFSITSTPTTYPAFGSITYPGFNGTIRIQYDNLRNLLRDQSMTLTTVRNLFPDVVNSNPIVNDYYHDPILISAVFLPNGQTYQFKYNPYAEVARVTLPTGGVFEYDYVSGTGSGGGDYADTMIYRRVKEKRSYNAGTREQRIIFDAPAAAVYPHTVTATYKAVNDVTVAAQKHYFYKSPTDDVGLSPTGYPSWREGLEYQTDWLKSDGTTVLRTQSQTWMQRGPQNTSIVPSSDLAQPNDPRITETDTTLGAVTARTTYAYSIDAFNNRTDTNEYDYGSIALKRHTHTDYVTDTNYTNSSVHLRSLPLQATVDDGTVTNSMTHYLYDETQYPLTDRPTMVGHNNVDRGLGFTYRGNATTVQRWLDTKTKWLQTVRWFDIAGNVVQTKDAIQSQDPVNGKVVTYKYDDSFSDAVNRNTFGFVTQQTDFLGHVTDATYDYGTGNLHSITEPHLSGVAGAPQTTFDYSDSLDRVRSVTYPVGRTDYTYDDTAGANRVTATRSQQSCTASDSIVVETTYDSLGRENGTVQHESATAFIYTTRSFDAMGRPYQVSNPYRTGDAVCNTTTLYDEVDRVTSVSTCDGATVGTAYTNNDATITDADSRTRKVTNDALGRVSQVLENPSGLLGDPSYTTTYDYDGMDRIRHVTQGIQSRSFVYDTVGRLTSTQSPETQNLATSYTYDDNGNILTKTDPRGVTACYGTLSGGLCTSGYDAENRPLLKSYSDGTPQVSYVYDSDLAVTGHLETNYPVHRLSQVVAGSSRTTYRYDAMGRLTSSLQRTDTSDYVFAYTFNQAGALATLTYPSGRTVTTCYDAAGRSNKVANGSAASTDVYASVGSLTDYAPHGVPKYVQLGNGLWQTSAAFTAQLQPQDMRLGTARDASDRWRIVNDYGSTNNNGNLRRQDIYAPQWTSPLTQMFGYDSLNRLSLVVEKPSNLLSPSCPDANSQWCEQYSFGQYGNRTITARTNIGTSAGEPSSYDLMTNRPSGTGWAHDAAGNLTANPLNETAVYDGESRQIAFCTLDSVCQAAAGAGRTLYTYDGEGRRVKKSVCTGTTADQCSTTAYAYDGLGQLAAEYSMAAPPAAGRVYVTADQLGTTRTITTSTGAIAERRDYRPFGDLIIPATGDVRLTAAGYAGATGTVQTGTTIGFTGKEHDGESRLDYFGARYVSGMTGRFTSPDPLLGSAQHTQPQTWNRYTYGLNNPLRNTDPSGLYDWDTSAGGSYTDEELRRRQANRDLTRRERNAAKNALKFREKFRTSLAAASVAANDSGQETAQQSAAAYGTENDKNGVFVGVRSGQRDPGATLLNDDGTISVTFSTGVKGDYFAATIAHEGRHVGDAAVYATFPIPGAPWDLTHYQREQRAWFVSSYMAEALGMRYAPPGADDKPNIQVWNRGWREADRNMLRSRGIGTLLREYYSLTPGSPGVPYSAEYPRR